ncbi:MAG: GNAT family N-acetyltransferase [Pseudomonadota bacterium]
MALTTPRLLVRPMTDDDAPFILRLLNEPSFLHFIGDKAVRDLDDARRYIASGPGESYARFGFGLYLVLCRDSGLPAGICGLVQRPSLRDVDLGFAFVPEYWSQGFAAEASAAVLHEAWERFELARVVAVTVAENARSIRLLERLGFRFDRIAHPFGADDPVNLYVLDRPDDASAAL